MTTATTQQTSPSDDHFNELMAAMKRRFGAIKGKETPLVIADGDAKRIFLDALPDDGTRQHYNCSACKSFLDRYGGLAVVKQDGRLESAIFPEDWEGELAPAVNALHAAIQKAGVKRAPKLKGTVAGKPENVDEKRDKTWTHFHINTPKRLLPHDARDRFNMLRRGISEFPAETLTEGHKLLTGGNIPQGERHAEMCAWLLEASREQTNTTNKRLARNLLWKRALSAPPGYCNFRGGALGSLLEDVAANKDFSEIKRRFGKVMDPLKYQRPQSVSTGQLERAEALVEELGIASAMRRRMATLDDLQTIWTPKAEPKGEESRGGVFGHVKAKDEVPQQEPISQPATRITWEKFRKTVLPDARQIEVRTPSPRGNYFGFTTAADPEAPPIIQWPNPVSHYVYHQGSPPQRWGLPGNEFVSVEAITLAPHMWEDEEAFPHQGKWVGFVILGAHDQREDGRGSALFPSTLKSELHGIRAAVEAYSLQTPFEECPGAPAAGLIFTNQIPVLVRVNRDTKYEIDRWD